jgi:hypothetical protein
MPLRGGFQSLDFQCSLAAKPLGRSRRKRREPERTGKISVCQIGIGG